MEPTIKTHKRTRPGEAPPVAPGATTMAAMVRTGTAVSRLGTWLLVAFLGLGGDPGGTATVAVSSGAVAVAVSSGAGAAQRSRVTARPCPTPTHNAATPKPEPAAASWWASDPASRAPEQPRG